MSKHTFNTTEELDDDLEIPPGDITDFTPADARVIGPLIEAIFLTRRRESRAKERLHEPLPSTGSSP
jgi:hypothetical protein